MCTVSQQPITADSFFAEDSRRSFFVLNQRSKMNFGLKIDTNVFPTQMFRLCAMRKDSGFSISPVGSPNSISTSSSMGEKPLPPIVLPDGFPISDGYFDFLDEDDESPVLVNDSKNSHSKGMFDFNVSRFDLWQGPEAVAFPAAIAIPIQRQMYFTNVRDVQTQFATLKLSATVEQKNFLRPAVSKKIQKEPRFEAGGRSHKKKLFNQKSQKPCPFCRNNNHPDDHYCKNERGEVICPRLRRYTCPKCGATGKDAHTIRSCPIAELERRRELEASIRRP